MSDSVSVPQVLCSTGALGYRPDLLGSSWLPQAAPGIACDGFELMLYYDWTAQKAMDGCLRAANDVRFPVAHLSKRLGERYAQGTADSIAAGHAILRDNCALAHAMGSRQGVLHLWSLPFGDDNFAVALDALGDAMNIAAEYDVELLVETIPCRAAPLLQRLQQIARAYPRCRFTADTRLLCCEGALQVLLDADWLWEQARIAHVHVSDCGVDDAGLPASHPILLPGQGIIDLEAFFNGLKRRGYRSTVTLESPAPKLPNAEADIAALNDALKAVAGWLSTPAT